MHKKLWKKFSALMAIALMITGCQFSGQERSPEATARPTTSPDERRLPTEPAGPEPVFDFGELHISNEMYVHPSGSFELLPPANWYEDTSPYGSVYINEPGGEGVIYVTVTKTGHALSPVDFERFVTAREENFFMDFDQYSEQLREMDAEIGEARVIKTLDYEGVGNTAETYYYLRGDSVFVIDLWSETTRLEEYQALYDIVMASFAMTPELSDEFPLYNFVWTFSDPLDAFSFEIPISWQYEYAEHQGTLCDLFWAPDRKAVLVHLHIPGQADLERDAQIKLLLAELEHLLPEIVRNPIEVEQREHESGGLLVTWHLKESSWEMQVLVQSDAEDLMALAGLYANESEESYLSTIEYGFDWYSVPAAEE